MVDEELLTEDAQGIAKIPLIAALVSLVGIADSAYLTVKHYAGEPVPCSLVEGCEKVLTSPYAEFAGVPIAAAGLAAYFTAFSLAILSAFGNRAMWQVFGIVAFLMAAFSFWLIYLQAFVIEAFCQFCLISAASSIIIFVLYAASKIFAARAD